MNKYTRKYSILCYVFHYDTDFFSTSGVTGLHGPHLSIISPVLLQFLLISTMCCPLSSFLFSMFLIIDLLFLRRLNSHETQTILLSWFLPESLPCGWSSRPAVADFFRDFFKEAKTTLAHSPGGDPLYLQDLAQMRGDGAVQRLQFLVPPKLCVCQTESFELHCRREELWTLLDTEWTGCSKCRG